MSDQDYTKKLESLRRYIPFLVNMMAELKAKGNREAQLAKIQSLHDMITDTRKKLKLETLRRCEEVLTNIYFKVNPQLRGSKTESKPDSPTTLPGIESPRSTPQSPSPPRDVILTKPITIPTEKIANLSLGCSAHKSPKSHRPKIDVYSNAVIDNPTKTKPLDIITKVPDMSKPPISLDDLRTLEDDVQQKINDATFVNKSVDELQEVRKQLQLQLRVDEVTAKMSPEKPKEAAINTTVRNNLTFSSKRLSYSESKHKQNKEIKSPSPDKKINKQVIKDSPTSSKSSKKQEDIFGSLLSSIDNKLLEEKKKSKKHERRSSKEDSGSTTSLSSDKSDSKSRDSKDRRSSSDSSKHRRSSIDKDRTKDKKRDENRDKGKTDKSKSETKHHRDNKEKKDEQKVKETKDKDKISSGSKSSSETDILNSSDTSKSELPTFKRLADKYKPKPKQKIVETDVEKSVSDSIEELMKVSPVKGLTSPLGPPQPVGPPKPVGVPQPIGPPKPIGVPQPVPPPKPIQEDAAAASTGEQKKPVQLPDILQKIFSKPLLGDIIPKRLTEPISSLAQNRTQNSSVVMTKPGAIQPPEPPVLSPPHRPLQFKPPPASLNFVSPPHVHSPDMMGRHTHVTSSPAPGIGQMPNTGPGILPTPPIPPNLPAGFMEHDVMNMGYGTPRMDFDTPGTPMPDFSSPSPRVDFDQPGFMRNDQFNVNQQRFMPMEHQMHGFDPRNANFMAQQNMYLNQGHMGYYGANQMPMHNPEVPHYMPDQTFYQERSRWARDRYPGDPRNYKEYKEMKERQEKAAQEKQREIKDPRLALRDPRLSKEANNESGSKEKPETAVRDPRLARPREKSVERPRNEFREDRSRERGSRDRTDDRSMSRESRPRSRFKNSKFDQMYSQWNRGRSRSRSRGREDADKSEEEFMSPLDSLYNAGEKGRTGRGYGVQNFRIPRKPKSVEETRREERNSSGSRHRRRVIEISDSDESDSNNVDDGPTPDNDSDLDVDNPEEVKDELEKEVKNDVEATKIEVVIKPGDDFWKTDASDDFVSEYDKEFENETKYSVKHEEPIPTSSPKCANQVESNSSETKVQVEEPSSSQDVIEQSPKIKQAENDTFTKPAEPDSSKKADGAATPQETTSKNDEPSEQNILAHFFQNLLKSSNKNDKKTALFSLIETFSDSFEDKEIQKIRKIIKANEEPEATSDEEKEEAGAAKAETEQEFSTKNASSVQEEQPVVGSTTTEEEIKDATPETEAAKSSINETQVHEVSKSTDESELQDTEQEKSEESLNETKDRSLEPVMVSVGERIKNRRRKKFKTELDLLHENIQEMFIRDGVLTATGKRMCRILKDDPNVLANDSDQAPPASVTEEQPKKIRRKPGPKPKQKPANLDNSHTSMKDMRVVIKKMPDEVLNTTTTRQLRNRTRQSSYAEDEADSILDNMSFASSVDGESDKSDLEGESANESEEEDKSSLGTEVIRKPRGKRRKVPKWASGIISKVKKKKTPQSKSKENSPERIPTPALSATSDVASISEFDLEPDKDYYYDYTNRRKLKCKLCKYSGHFLTGHYLKEHPHSEVLCSRFAPEKAIEAIKDISENGEILERIAASNLKSKFNYSCRMCGYTSCISSIFFYEHVTTHTGEYRHQCGICEYSAVTSKTMKVHFAAIHPDLEKKVIVKTYSPPVVFAYICEDCNFVQMKEKSVQDHVNIFHLGKKPSIHKINMSTTIDPALKAFVDKLSAETDSAAKPEIAEDKAEETPKRRKPGPKSKKPKALETEEKAKEMAAEEETDQTSEEKQDNASAEQVTKEKDTEKDITTPVRRKKPGPKSKTLPVPEAETPTLTEEVEVRSLRKRAGPKPKTLTSKVAEEFIEDTAQQPLDAPTPPPENVAAKEVPARKRRRSLDKLINEDSGDDLDTIITLSSRSSRAAKEKATAKLKTLMENNEGMPTKRKPESETPKKDKEIETEPQEAEQEVVREEEAVETQNEQHQVAAVHPTAAVNNDETSVEAVNNREEEAVVETQNEQHQVTAMHLPAVDNREEEAVLETQNEQHQVKAMHPPAVNNDATSVESNDKDLNVFTCKNDILQDDAKQIEEERLRKMNELNKSIISRTLKHDFINKLSNRLTNEEQSNESSPVQVKAEPKDTSNNVDASAAPGDTSYEPIIKTPPITKVNKSPVLSRKPVLEEEPTVQQPNIKFRQNKPNSLFSNMIEKLQGKVNEAAVQEDNSNLESSVDETTSNDSQTSSSVPEVFISIGDLIRATKTDKEIIYSCHANKCYVATKDKMVFQLHCKFGHKELNLKSSLCEKCGVVVEVTPDTTLLENLYDHLVFAHSDFLSRSTLLRMRRLSGDKLSIKKEKEAAPAAIIPEPQDFEAGIERHYVSEEGSQQATDVPMETASTAENEEQPAASEATLELAEDNPFSFKIESVMSLADSNDSASPIKATAKVPTEASPKPPLPPLKHVPPLTLIGTGPKPTGQSLVVKEAKLTPQELSRPKKAQKALQKFIDCPQDLYKCPHFYCMFSTKIRTLMMCHLRAHKCDNDTMVPCVYCDMKTPWKDVPMHIELRHANCKYSCYYCMYRAALREYVCLHQEQCHPNLDYVIICLQIHKSVKKFSVADPKTDLRTLLEPFRCFCKSKEDGESVVHEYLFEKEFLQHLSNAHPHEFLVCGYPKCTQKELGPNMMLNHWAMFHGVCVYQCGHCKTGSNNIAMMYLHFSQNHPSLPPNILVRKNDFLPQDREVRFTDEAFKLLGHIKKISPALVSSIAKRTQRNVKLIQLDNPNGSSEETTPALRVAPTTTTTASSASVLRPSPSALTAVPTAPKLHVPTSNVKLIVATSVNNDKLYLLPASMMAPVTSTAPMSKVIVQTSSASSELLKAAAETAPQQPVKFGGITLYPSDESQIYKPLTNQESSVVTAISSLVTSTPSVASSTALEKPLLAAAAIEDKEPKMSAKIKSISKISRVESPTNNAIAQENEARGDLASENDSTALSEDDMLQSAIQSILDQEDDDSTNSNTRLESDITNTSSEKPRTESPSLLPGIMLDPPPLVLFNNSTSAVAATSPRPSTPVEAHTEAVTPVEHVDVAGTLSPLINVESDEGSNSEIPFFNDNDDLDPLSEDPLTITPTLNTALPDDPLRIEEPTMDKDPLHEVQAVQQPVIHPPESVVATQEPLKIITMQRSASMVSNSDDESDSGASEKKKRGLIGYQLFRCAVCNLSFSNVRPFKSHIISSQTCKKPGFRVFHCVHCDKGLKTPQRLADHIMTHGLQRFSCSLCNEKFTTVAIAKLHMKNRHSIHQTSLLPLNPAMNDMETDNFVIKPGLANVPIPKDKETASESPKSATDDLTYTPELIDSIPIRQIFSSNVKCGLCNYQTKVRVNIIRHLQMHLEEKAVSDTAPVNPVPCLEKNEKMFDKMINLAASSITTAGRMGGSVKDKEKEEEQHPEFIPTHRRFVCCAQGCSYLCPEEANLKHHLMALHSDETNFTCAHCKVKIEPKDIESVIKHFKVHGLHLYKCQYCSFIHHLKHKVERHISDGHLDMAVRVVTIRCMESEPQEFVPQEEVAPTPPPTASSKFKPWNCGMCKAKYHTREDIQAHIIKKHNIDAQYKCTLCAFKNDEEDSFKAHFQEKHPSHELDMIFVYQKIEEELPKDDSGAAFDTTPLWQRDKPRVRHIRGILFDESSPQPTKSPKKLKTYGGSSAKASANTTPKASPVVSVSSSPKITPSTSTSVSPIVNSASKNLFDCIEAVARGTAETLMNMPGSSGVSPTKKASSIQETAANSSAVVPPKLPERRKSVSAAKKGEIKAETIDDDVVVIPQTSSIIVIDSDDSDSESAKTAQSKDDDTPKSKDKDSKIKPMAKNRSLKRQGGVTDLLEEAVKMAKIKETDDEDYIMAANCSAQNLISLYGELGTPHNKQWKCPKCKKFKSKRVGDFMFHIYKDFNTYRYRCKVCLDLSITYKYMQDHIKLHAGCNEDIIEPLTPDIKLETWIHMVVREQSLIILKNGPLFKKRPVVGQTDITCYFCNDKFMSMPECCEHMLYHWVMMPYQCQHCPHEFYTIYDLKHHHKIEHPDARLYTEPKGPTLSRVIQCIENPKKRPAKFCYSLALKKKPRLDDASKDAKMKKEEITSGIVINAQKGKKPQKPSPPTTDAVITLDDDEDDLVIVSKTDDHVPIEDNVFACDMCVYITEFEILVVKHLAQEHGVRANKYHILSKTHAEIEAGGQKMACNICDEVFMELKLRRHFIQNHFKGQTYAPYRFKCLLCSAKFLVPSRIKVHFARVHPDSRISYQCIIPSMKSSEKKAKHKQYCCTFCSYSTVSTTTVTIRSHLKGHLKPMLCTYCNGRFRYHSEVVAHSAKEHPEQKAAQYVTLDDVMTEFSETMKLITERAVVLSDDYGVHIMDAPLKSVAKKSTSAPCLPLKAGEDEAKQELDLTKITTTFELDQLEYTTTAEQMLKMFNMDTYVDMSSCVVDIMPLDNS